MRHTLPRAALLAFGALLALPLAGCVTNAATGRSQLNALSREEEIEIGTVNGPEFAKEYGGTFADAQVQAYLREVGMKLVAQVEGDYATLPWEFTLLDSDVINAFSLPGGKVYFSRGLAEKFKTEAELAGVLGHEVGHVTAEHADKRISSAMIAQGLIIGGSVALGATAGAEVAAIGQQVLGGAGQGFLLKFGRDEENESDALGLRYMTKAGYNPEGMLRVMEVLRDAGGGGGQPEWLSTHPLPETRIKRIQATLQQSPYAEARANPKAVVGESEFKTRFLNRVLNAPRPPAKAPAQAQPAQSVAPTGKRRN